MYCTYCGGELREGSEFCTKCGQRLAEVSAGAEVGASVNVEAQNMPASAPAPAAYAEPPVLRIKCVSCDKPITDEGHPVNNCPYCGTSQLPTVYPQAGFPSAREQRRAARLQRRAEFRKRINRPRTAAVMFIAIAAVVCTTGVVASISNEPDVAEEIVWSSSGLSQMLPEFDETVYGYIVSDSNDAFVVDISGISKAEFGSYADLCRSSGFDVDAERDSYSFTGYNDKGYKLELDRYDYSGGDEMRISLTAPMEMRALRFADKGLAAMLPELPEGAVGHIEMDSADFMSFYVGETDREGFDEYVASCISGGFDVDYNRTDDSFYGENDNGDYISVNYLGGGIMQVNLSRD